MRKVLWHVTMSLDGFIAGPGDAIDWVLDRDSGPSAEVEEVLQTLGAVLVGRRSYDVGQRQQRPELRKLYGGAAPIDLQMISASQPAHLRRAAVS
jgi:dihydrofolate reductase